MSNSNFPYKEEDFWCLVGVITPLNKLSGNYIKIFKENNRMDLLNYEF